MKRLFDLSFVIGSFFFIVGLLLEGYSFLSGDQLNNAQNVNRWCGLVFIVFGIIMILLSSRTNNEDSME